MKEKENKKKDLEEMRKQIVIARLRQAPPNVKVSFGMSDGRFLDRDELIEQVEEGTEMGRKIVDVQMAYLRALKKQLTIAE